MVRIANEASGKLVGSLACVAALTVAGCADTEASKQRTSHPAADSGALAVDSGGSALDSGAPAIEAGGPGVDSGACDACTGATPVCQAGICVECGADDVSTCATGEACDLAKHACVDVDASVANCGTPGGDALLHVDFEDGTLHGFELNVGTGATLSVDTALGANGTTGSLKLDSPTWPAAGGSLSLPGGAAKASYVEFYVRRRENGETGELSVFFEGLRGSKYVRTLDAIVWYDLQLSTNSQTVGTPSGTEWMRVQLRDIDWEAGTFDFYVDCDRIGNDVFFAPSGASNLARIGVSGTEGGSSSIAWLDEILIK